MLFALANLLLAASPFLVLDWGIVILSVVASGGFFHSRGVIIKVCGIALVILVLTGILPGSYGGTSDDIFKTHQRHIPQRCSSINASLCKSRFGEQVQLHLRITE